MNDSDNIKALIPVVCPNCNVTSVVEFLIAANLLTPDAAKEVLAKVEQPPVVEPVNVEKHEPEEEE